MEFNFKVNGNNFVASIHYTKGNGYNIPRCYYLNIMSGHKDNNRLAVLNPLGYNHNVMLFSVNRKSKKRLAKAEQKSTWIKGLKYEINKIKETQKREKIESNW